MCAAAPTLCLEQEHHLPRAHLPVKHNILQMSERPLKNQNVQFIIIPGMVLSSGVLLFIKSTSKSVKFVLKATNSCTSVHLCFMRLELNLQVSDDSFSSEWLVKHCLL